MQATSIYFFIYISQYFYHIIAADICLSTVTTAIYISHRAVMLYVSTSLSPLYTPVTCLVVKEEMISNTNLKELPKT